MMMDDDSRRMMCVECNFLFHNCLHEGCHDIIIMQ